MTQNGHNNEEMHRRTKIQTYVPDLVLVFGTSIEPDPWCLGFSRETLQLIARRGEELVFTAKESPAALFNPPLIWRVSLFCRDGDASEFYHRQLLSAIPCAFEIGDGIIGMAAHSGHSLQIIGLTSSQVERLARQRGLSAQLLSAPTDSHRDYYVVDDIPSPVPQSSILIRPP